jgi:hypothetical protein
MKWGPDLKRATQLTSRSMIIPFLESFPEIFKIEIENKTHHAVLASSSGGEVVEKVVEKKEVEKVVEKKKPKQARSTRAIATVKKSSPKIITLKRAVSTRAVKRAPPKITGVRGAARRATVK